jgi:hypothetical protein
VIALVLADWWEAKREMDHLSVAVTVSKIAMATGYFSVNPDMKNTGDDTFDRALETKCARAAADVQDTGAQVSEVFVLPWHRSLRAAQDAYLAYSKAWQNKFAACADNLTRWSEGSTSAQIDASGRTAHRAFLAAVPAADGTGRDSVEAVFKNDVTSVQWEKIVASLVR